MFNGLSANTTTKQNVANPLSSHAMMQSGANVTLTDLAGDVLTLMGANTTSLSRNAGSALKLR